MKILFSIALFCMLTTFALGTEVKKEANIHAFTEVKKEANIPAYKAVDTASSGPDAYFKTKACRTAFINGPHPEYKPIAGTFLWPEAQVFVCP